MNKTTEKANELIEKDANNQYLYSSGETSMKGEVKTVSTESDPPEQSESLTQQLHSLTQKLLSLQEVLQETHASNKNSKKQREEETTEDDQAAIQDTIRGVECPMRDGTGVQCPGGGNLGVQHQERTRRGVERPERGDHTRVISGNTSPRQAGSPSSGTIDTYPTPPKTDEYKTKMPYPQKFRQAEKISSLPDLQITSRH
ncbi:hypothetical protein AHAS_Ahas14G0102500 [Arachis hypogaea]